MKRLLVFLLLAASAFGQRAVNSLPANCSPAEKVVLKATQGTVVADYPVQGTYVCNSAATTSPTYPWSFVLPNPVYGTQMFLGPDAASFDSGWGNHLWDWAILNYTTPDSGAGADSVSSFRTKLNPTGPRTHRMDNLITAIDTDAGNTQDFDIIQAFFSDTEHHGSGTARLEGAYFLADAEGPTNNVLNMYVDTDTGDGVHNTGAQGGIEDYMYVGAGAQVDGAVVGMNIDPDGSGTAGSFTGVAVNAPPFTISNIASAFHAASMTSTQTPLSFWSQQNSPGYAFYANGTASSYLKGGLILESVAPTAAASQVALGGTVAASTNCGSLTGFTACLVINVAGTTRYIPYK